MSVAAAQSIFINRLLSGVASRLPNVDRATIISTGATDLQRVFPLDQLLAVRESYLDGLHASWAMAIAFAGAALLTGLSLGFKAIKKPQGKVEEHIDDKSQEPSPKVSKEEAKKTGGGAQNV
jgi:hypothetical protein